MRLLLVCVFIDMAGFGIVLPLLPFYAEELGATPFQIASLVSAYAGAQLVSSSLLGRLSDRIGRKPVLVGCMLGSAAGFACLASAQTLWVVFAARALGGAAGASFPTANAFLADGVPEERRAEAMGTLAAAYGLGLCAGPAIGALLASSWLFGGDLDLAFWAAAALSAAAGGLAAVRLEEPRSRARTGRPGGFAALLRRPGVRAALAATAVVEMCVGSLLAFFPIWAGWRFQWGSSETGAFFLLFAALLCTVQALLVGMAARRFGEVRVILGSFGLIGLGFLSIDGASSWPLLTVSTALLCLGVGLAIPTIHSYATLHSPGSSQGTTLGMLESVTSLAHVVGPLLAGGLIALSGPAWPGRACAAVALLALATAIAWRRADASRSAAAADAPPRDSRLSGWSG